MRFKRMNSSAYLANYFGIHDMAAFNNFIIHCQKFIGRIHYDHKDSRIIRLDDWQTLYLVLILFNRGNKKARKVAKNWNGYLMWNAKKQYKMPYELTD